MQKKIRTIRLNVMMVLAMVIIFSSMNVSVFAANKATSSPSPKTTSKATPKPTPTKSSKIKPTPTKTPAPKMAYTYSQLKSEFEDWVKKNSIPIIYKEVEKDLSEKTKKDTLNFVLTHRNDLIKAKDDANLKKIVTEAFYQEMVKIDEFVHMEIKDKFYMHMTTTWLDFVTNKLSAKKLPRATQQKWLKDIIKYFVTYKEKTADEMMKGFDVSFDPKVISELSINDIVNALASNAAK